VTRFIRETVLSSPWLQEDTKCKPEEESILDGWNLPPNMPTQGKKEIRKAISPQVWSPPPPGFHKLNFDGASRNNPGPAGFGAVLRDHMGKITFLIAGSLGENTNNAAELSSLVKGLQMAVQMQHTRLIIEGDSQIIIQLATRILNGQPPWRTSPSWRLLGLLEEFKDIINPNLILIPSHVRRDANRVADHLANKGIDTHSDLIHWQANVSTETELSHQCRDLADRDFQFPYGVTSGNGVPTVPALSQSLNAGRGIHTTLTTDGGPH
jgi:ribonuclease HI